MSALRRARVMPKYPRSLRGTDGISITQANGVATIGFDYTASELGTELQQAVDAADADATATAADRVATAADVVSSAANAAAAAASAAASASLAVANRTAMAALDPSTVSHVELLEGMPALVGRMGTFYGTTSDISAIVARDPEQGVSVAVDSDPTGASGGFLRRWLGSVEAPWFGAKGDASTDDTDAIQAAIDYFTSGNGSVRLPTAVYKTVSQISIVQERIHLYGDERAATSILFAPTADSTAIKVEAAAGAVYYQGSIRDLSFYSNDTTYKKVAIHLMDCSAYQVHGVGTVYPHWEGAGSIFLSINGRELGSIRDIDCVADQPIYIGPISSPHTAGGIGCDHHNFHNMYLVSGASYPLIVIDDNVPVSQLSFTGFQSWVGGSYGLYWNDTVSPGVSNGILIENIRVEQGSDATKQTVYISHNVGVQGIRIAGGQLGADRKGFYFRTCENIHFDAVYYTGATLALDVDSTVKRIAATNCFWQASSTANISGQRLVYATPKNPSTGALPPNFIYDQSANTLTASQINQLIGGAYTLADSANTSAVPALVGAAIVTSSSSTTFALVALRGSTHTTTIVSASDAGYYSNTKDNAGTVNIYYDSGDGTYHVQNKTGSTTTITVTPFGQQ